jgi:hypothetical protein
LLPSAETEGALQAALVHTPPGLERVIRLDSPALRPDVDVEGGLVAVPRQDGTVRLLSLKSFEEVRMCGEGAHRR